MSCVDSLLTLNLWSNVDQWDSQIVLLVNVAETWSIANFDPVHAFLTPCISIGVLDDPMGIRSNHLLLDVSTTIAPLP